MVKKLLSLFIICLTVKSVNAQSFGLKYTFAAVTNSSGPIDPTPAQVATGVSTNSWAAVGTGTNSTGAAYFSFTGWGTGATSSVNTTFTGSIDPAKYYEVTLTPQAGYSVTLNNMTFGASRSTTGIRHFAVRTNKDSYAANVAATYTPLNSAASTTVITIQGGDTFFWFDDVNSTSGPAAGSVANNQCGANFSGPNFTNQSSPYIIRIYAWNSEAAGGTFRIDSLMINGVATFSTAGFGSISHDLSSSFKLYPNPTNNGVVYIESKNANKGSIEIVNVLGKVVAREGIESNYSTVKLDLSALTEGTYFVRCRIGNKVITEKLMITK
ncbi:MAG: T9SS type A sorting domain-containing protein [Sphingobacteriaceae bacterium]|nr:T9SS type A sorting domain-containing protein [Sphingobacteriaceae bacterium]MBK7817595.1 T9SS type A sorting domain-containing protein [Sphingobacteriaceae bacterium]